MGDIEFVIDKIDINQPENKVKLLQRFVRHMQTYKDIKSEQSARFDHLLIKSLDQPLSEEELGEFNALNVIRSKVLLDEGCISETDLRTLKEQNELLTDIEAKLQEIVDGK